MMLAARGAIRASGAGLPYDAEVEYLESTGTQWIDSGVEGTSDLDVDFVISSKTASNIAMLGIIQEAPAGYSGYFRYHYSPEGASTAFWVQVNSSGPSIVLNNFVSDKIYHWNVKPTLGLANCNGTSVSFTPLPQGVKSYLNFYIFARNGFNGIQSAPNKVYSFKMWQNGILVRDYIPVRRGTVGYLYDRVSRKLFGNAGSGAFVLGPDVVPVEWLESHGTECVDTGVVPTTNSICSIMVKLMEAGHNGVYVGAMDGGAHRFHLTRNDFGLNEYVNYSNGSVEPFTKCDLELNAKEWYCKKDGVATAATSTKVLPSLSVFLFARHTSTGLDRGSKIQMDFCKIWDNSLPVRSFHPVRVGTGLTWEGAMMDVLTRRIYRNAGTGAFTFGNDLKYPIPA